MICYFSLQGLDFLNEKRIVTTFFSNLETQAKEVHEF